MPDIWKTLRTSVKNTAIGNTFSNSLLDGTTPPSDIGTRTTGGGIVMFSDTPETISSSTLLADGVTLASSVGYDCILFTDTNELQTNVLHRLFLHHVNSTGTNRSLYIRAINLGTAEARLQFGPTFGGVPDAIVTAGLQAAKDFLDATPSNSAVPPADLDISVVDQTPAVNTTQTTIPVFDGTLNTVVTLATFDFQNGKLISAHNEMLALDPGIHIYVVVDDPPVGCYQNDDQTCARNLHARGTFEQRCVSRIEDPYVINNGLETPGRIRLVTIASEENPYDVNWPGSDRTLWAGSVADNNVGYSRTFYTRVTAQNTSGSSKNFAIVASPRNPSSAFFGYVRDVGGANSVRVPTTGSVATGDSTKGTVIWKGAIGAGASINKRIRYTPAGASSAKLSIWVIAY